MPFTRHEVEFQSRDLRCAAWVYQPDADGPLPLVVMAHGFSGTREMRLNAYAERFAQEGIAALVFDYRHFGPAPANRASCSTSAGSRTTGGRHLLALGHSTAST